MVAAIRESNPVVFIDDRWLYRLEEPVPEEIYTVEIGRARVARAGRDVTIVASSFLVQEALQAAALLVPLLFGVGWFRDSIHVTEPAQGLADALEALPDGAAQLADGSAQLSDGVGQYVDGINQIVDPAIDVLADYPQLVEIVQRISGDQEGLDQAVATMRQAWSTKEPWTE